MKDHNRCGLFSTGFDKDGEECGLCKDNIECKKEFDKEQFQIVMGTTEIKAIKPIPVKNPIMFKLSSYTSKEVKMEIIINIEWLKEQLKKLDI